VRPSRQLGQSFLVDPYVADAEAALVEAPPGTPILEIGPGLGALTKALLRRGLGPLTVLERDPRLATVLREELGDRVTVLEGDARSDPLPPTPIVVGNLPFSAATPILVRLLRARVPKVVVMVQSEVADRLLASPGTGEYGRLTLLARLHAELEGFLPVPAESFEPIPAVGGRVVVLCHRTGPLPVPDEPAFEEMTRRLFASRRKQLKNLLPSALPEGAEPASVARAAGWPDDWAHRRPEELPWEAYFRLASHLGEIPSIPRRG
jgi:16S rRNA (adenine1518-N6/adenine1519-N6)-dimethyltransferase